MSWPHFSRSFFQRCHVNCLVHDHFRGCSWRRLVFLWCSFFFLGAVLWGASCWIVAFFFGHISYRKVNMQEYAVALSFVNFFGAYVIAEVLNASGATAVIASGLVLGGTLKKPVYGVTQGKVFDFWSNVSFLARSIIFLVLGAGFSLAALSSVWLEATVVILLLFLVIRPISVFSATSFEKKLSKKEKLFISWVGTRGQYQLL